MRDNLYMNNSLIICDKAECFGCTACYSICPVDAIEMQPDDEGFEYPQINDVKCVGCGLCLSVCPNKKEQ